MTTDIFINQITNWAGSSPLFIVLLAALSIWSLVWKGLALWKASQLGQKYWFVALLVINTLGILEIIYIFVVAKKYKVEVVEN